MAVAAGSRKPAPLEPVQCTSKASPSASSPDRPSIHYRERSSFMKNRKREIRTSGSVRDEDGQHPHLLGRLQFLHLAASAAMLPAATRIAWAQTYPTRPITMVVPFPAGGERIRLHASWLSACPGRSCNLVIIENVAGADGSIGAGRVARATPDGALFGHYCERP